MAVSSLAKSLQPIAFRSSWVPIECRSLWNDGGTVVEPVGMAGASRTDHGSSQQRRV